MEIFLLLLGFVIGGVVVAIYYNNRVAAKNKIIDMLQGKPSTTTTFSTTKYSGLVD